MIGVYGRCFSSSATFRNSHRSCSVKKVSLDISQNSQENTCAMVTFLNKVIGSNFIEKETQARVFSCEFYEISKNTFSTEHLQTTASGHSLSKMMQRIINYFSRNCIFKILLPDVHIFLFLY